VSQGALEKAIAMTIMKSCGRVAIVLSITFFIPLLLSIFIHDSSEIDDLSYPWKDVVAAASCLEAADESMLPDDVRTSTAMLRNRLEKFAASSEKAIGPRCNDASDDTKNLYSPETRHTEKYNTRSCNNIKGEWGFNVKHATKCKYMLAARLLGIGPRTRVLEIGSGCGHATDFIRRQYGAYLIGTDIAPPSIEWANEHLDRRNASFCLVSPGDALQFENASIDVVLSNAMLCHLPPKSQCTFVRDEILRVLKKGGCAWFGWRNGDEAEYEETTPEFWQDCFAGMANEPAPAFALIDEKPFFGAYEYMRGGALMKPPQSLFVCRARAAKDKA